MIRLITGVTRRHPGRMLLGLLVAVPVLAVIGGGVSDRLSVGGFLDPDAESTEVADVLEEDFGTGTFGFVLLLDPKDGFVYNDHNVAEGERIVADLEAEPGVLEAWSLYNVDVPPFALNPFQDPTGRLTIMGVVLEGDEDTQRETAERLHESYVDEPNDVFDISATGSIEVSRVAAEQAEQDLQFAELLAAPFTLIGLLIVFRGWRAASLPLAVAVFAVLGSFVALTLVASITDISIFARTLVTALGLGLAIDYSLLLVARFREERSHGRTVESAMSRTMQTAGRTVVFSAATVGSSLLGLLVFPVVYLRSFAFAGVAVVTMAALASLLVVPPALVRWGDRMGSAAAAEETFWGRQANRVMRRPLAWLVPITVVLVLLATPFAGLNPGRTDDRVLPEDSAARAATEAIRENFDWGNANTIHVLAPEVAADDSERIRAFTEAALEVPGVARVGSTIGFWRTGTPPNPPNQLTPHFFPNEGVDAGTWFNVLYWYDTDDPRVDEVIETFRTQDLGAGDVLVGGNNATVIDTVAAVTDGLPLALTVVGTVTYVLLFFMTGSLLVPLKAVVLNLLSLSATFGALVWIFQDGNLGGLSGVTATGELDVFTPILMFCVAFGLSMDYEVFLLARIKEEYDLTADNDEAVRVGIGRTGPIVTAAALLLAIVFLAIATSGVSIVRMFGFGLALAVLTDAFLVRGTITPALMKLAGRANWWAPRAVRRFHLRYGIWENEPIVRDPLAPSATLEAS